MWDTQTCYGHKFEPVCAAQVNSGLFAALLEMGDVMGTFCGHDHVNDFHGQYHGIRLCYGRSSGHSTYGRDGMLRGGVSFNCGRVSGRLIPGCVWRTDR